MGRLDNRRIVVGVTGGIAAYKSPELVRRLRDAGADVRVIMTQSARRFVGEITFQAVSGHAVRFDLLDSDAEAGMGHIELARWADVLLIAPATADFIARLSHGHADDLLTAVCLSTSAPVVLAPAMNQQMWRAAATQFNVQTLRARAVELIGPASGDQACGETGPGRMQEPAEIVERLSSLLNTGALAGKRVLVTAGPTREAIDAVRYISNRSSGLMGYAMAQAAAEAGGVVTLVTGPTHRPRPAAVACVEVESAGEMWEAVMRLIGDQDIFIGAAAVADYSCDAPASGKRKSDSDALTLTLTRTKDILAAVSTLPDGPFTVGFAAETDDLITNARDKLHRKAADMIAANWVGQAGRGFDSNDNELHVVWADGERLLQLTSKVRLARDLVALIAERYAASRGGALS